MPLLSFMWADHQLNDVSWLRADTFSWQAGSVYQAVYQHLADDITGKTLQSETVGGVTVQFYLADDGHKICPASEESNVASIYSATGVAWYFIVDTTNQRFKLPRDNTQNQRVLIKTITSGTKWARIYADGWVEQGDGAPGTFGTVNFLITMQDTKYSINFAPTDTYYVPRVTARTTTSFTSNGRNIDNSGLTGTTGFASWEVKGYADTTYLKNIVSQFDAEYKYLYFYVGQFTQTALENTAGINTEMFNDLNAHKVIEFQEPTAENNYTWYRKYADGWVEQGGGITTTDSLNVTFSLPVEMATNRYSIIGNCNIYQNTSGHFTPVSSTTTSFVAHCGAVDSLYGIGWWQVNGMAA